MDQHSVALSFPELAAERLGFFRWTESGDKILVTTDAGDWAFLTRAEFDDLLAGRIADGHARFHELQGLGLVRDGLDLDAFAARVARRNRHVSRGPGVHVVMMTGRTGPSGAGNLDMSRETAEQIVDLALQSNAPALRFELQGQGGAVA